MTDGLSEGDIVLVDFEAWTDEGDLFDTTRPKVAEQEGWDVDEGMEPMPVLLGGQRVVPGFEEALLEAEIGVEAEIDVPPTKAFGMHDSDQVRVFPRRDFEKQDMDPHPGSRVEIGGQQGTVVQATASRVRVDFNHPFAGKTLTYKFEVTEKLEEPEARLRALLGLDYDLEKIEGFEIEIEDDVARVTVPEDAAMDTQWFMAKHRLGHDIFENTDLESVELTETLTREDFEAHEHGAHGAAAPTAEADTETAEGDEDEADTDGDDAEAEYADEADAAPDEDED